MNTFQVVISTDGQLSFVTFLYDDIQWSEDNSQAGIFFFTITHVKIPGSARNLPTNSNVGVDGMWMYRVDSSSIIMPP